MNLQSVIVVRQVRHEYTQFTPVTQYRAGRGVASVSLDLNRGGLEVIRVLSSQYSLVCTLEKSFIC